MSVAEENWQTTKPTIRERSKFIFNNHRFSDVDFVVRKMNGESESKQVVPAHKFLLSISSPVFEAMFYGELAETTESIELPDCEYESLLELFRYMYSDKVNLSGSTVMGVFYLAKKYMVPSLADKCKKYLQKNLDASNVFSILPSAQKYEEKDLVDRCWKVIDKQTEEAVQSDGFATIGKSLLQAVVIRETLTIEETALFKAVDLWATRECERQGSEADGKTKRRILGEEIVKTIRFPTMKLEDFASVVLDSEILRKKEIVNIVKHLSSASKSPVGFPETKRSSCSGDIQRCFRFGSLSGFCSWGYGFASDAINFSVDRDIALHGVCFFGRENKTYSVDLTVKELQHEVTSISKCGQFTSELLQCEKGNYWGYKLLFDQKFDLKRNTKYCITAKITGPDSSHGMDGVFSIQCSGVTFTFTNAMGRTNGTCIGTGQFPELLFSL